MSRSRDGFAIIFGIFLVVVTIFLIIDIKLGQKLSGIYLPIPEPDLTVIKFSDNIPNRQQTAEIDLQIHGDSKKTEKIGTFGAFRRNLGLQYEKIQL